MSVRLVRHGEPEFDMASIVERTEVRRALERYERSTVTRMPPASVVEDIVGAFNTATAPIAVSSGSPRAYTSASLLGLEPVERSAVLNESRLPHPDVLPCRMSWRVMLLLFRCAWIFGYRRNADGWRADCRRAARAAAWLEEQASTHGDVIVFGHGLMHRLIARALTAQGWRRQKVSGRDYWSQTVLEKSCLRLDRQGTTTDAFTQ